MNVYQELVKGETIWAYLSPYSRKSNTRRIPRLMKALSNVKRITWKKRWIDIPDIYSLLSQKEYQLVSIVATAIATGEFPESRFVIKKIAKRNPEAKRSCHYCEPSIAAELSEESQLVVKRISKQNLEEDHYVTQI